MLDVASAERIILDLAHDLTRRLHAKGYTKSHAEIWIGRDPMFPCTVYIERPPADMRFIRSRAVLMEVVQDAITAIDELPDSMAMAPWFTVEPIPNTEEAA